MSSIGLGRAESNAVTRGLSLALGVLFGVGCLPAATLERLSLDEMAQKATSIVRGKITGSWVQSSGPVIFTHYRIQVSERLKGSGGDSVEVTVPGGVSGSLRQTFAGTPELTTGGEYVFFLWTGRSAMTQVIGLTQGVFSLAGDRAADPTATRHASRELMLDRSTGRPVKDQTLTMRMTELRARIAAALGAKGK